MITKQAIALVRQAVHEMRAVKSAACRPMQKKAFTAVELAAATPIAAALAYGAGKGVYNVAANKNNARRGALAGAGAAGVASAATVPLLTALLSRGRIPRAMWGQVGRTAATAGAAGAAGGGILGSLLGGRVPKKDGAAT